MQTTMKKGGGVLIGLAAGAAVGALIGGMCCRHAPAANGFRKKASKVFKSMSSVADAIGWMLR